MLVVVSGYDRSYKSYELSAVLVFYHNPQFWVGLMGVIIILSAIVWYFRKSDQKEKDKENEIKQYR